MSGCGLPMTSWKIHTKRSRAGPCQKEAQYNTTCMIHASILPVSLCLTRFLDHGKDLAEVEAMLVDKTVTASAA